LVLLNDEKEARKKEQIRRKIEEGQERHFLEAFRMRLSLKFHFFPNRDVFNEAYPDFPFAPSIFPLQQHNPARPDVFSQLI